MIVALLLTVARTALTGWLQTTDAFWGSSTMEEVHEVLATLILVLASLHVAGVLVESLRHHENLVLSMLTGTKRPLSDRDRAEAWRAPRPRPPCPAAWPRDPHRFDCGRHCAGQASGQLGVLAQMAPSASSLEHSRDVNFVRSCARRADKRQSKAALRR